MKTNGQPGSFLKQAATGQFVTLDDLRETEQRIIQAVKSMLSQPSAAVGKKWLKSYEVKKILGVSNGTLQTLRDNGIIPFTKLGGLIYYNISDIDVVMENLKTNKDQYGPGNTRKV